MRDDEDLAGRRGAEPLSRGRVAVINIGGVAFPPFAELFGPENLPYRCAIISDGDPPASTEDADDAQEDDDPGLSPVATALVQRESDNLHVRLAQRTLEWDLAAAGNWAVLLEALARVKPRVAASFTADHVISDPRERADALLANVADRKGSLRPRARRCLGGRSRARRTHI